MRKVTAILLALLICAFAFASCAGEKTPEGQTSSDSTTETAAPASETTAAPEEPMTDAPKPESTREWSDLY